MLSKKYKYLIGYLVIYHYYPLDKCVQSYLYIDLEDFYQQTESFWLSVLLDKSLFLKYLETQETMSEQVFFSGIVNEEKLNAILDTIKLRFEERLRRPRRLVTRKGYNDKGSRGTVSEQALRRGLAEDTFLSSYQLQLEEKQLVRSSKIALLRDFLLGTSTLTDEQLIEFKFKKGMNNYAKCQGTNGSNSLKNYIMRRAGEEHRRKKRKSEETAGTAGEKTGESSSNTSQSRKEE
jgi:hypothetical protein